MSNVLEKNDAYFIHYNFHAENSQPTIQTSFTEKKTGLFIAE